jgi:hypothetical protein
MKGKHWRKTTLMPRSNNNNNNNNNNIAFPFTLWELHSLRTTDSTLLLYEVHNWRVQSVSLQQETNRRDMLVFCVLVVVHWPCSSVASRLRLECMHSCNTNCRQGAVRGTWTCWSLCVCVCAAITSIKVKVKLSLLQAVVARRVVRRRGSHIY